MMTSDISSVVCTLEPRYQSREITARAACDSGPCRPTVEPSRADDRLLPGLKGDGADKETAANAVDRPTRFVERRRAE